MSFRKLSFELTPEQEKARQEMGAYLLNQTEIQTFMTKYACPQEVVVENASTFKRWVDAVRKSQKVTRLEVQEDLEKGRFIDLRYDVKTNILSEVISENPLVQDILDERAYLNQYKIFPLAENLKNARFSSLDFKNENPRFIEIMRKLMKFTDDDTLGYYIYGDLGVGKSYLSACVTNNFAEAGHAVVYVHVPTLLSYLKQLFHSPSELEYTMQRLKNAKVLVLDDLGAEPITSWSRDEILLSIINERLENKRKTIITGNYTPEMLVSLYKLDSRGTSDEIRARRLVDRILALTNPLEMVGENRRNR